MTALKIKEPADKKNPSHYLNNDMFRQALLEYEQAREAAEAAGLPKPQIPDYIGGCFLKIAKGVASKHNFRNYSFIDDMVAESVLICIKNIACYNPKLGTSAFAYFTQCVWYSFLGVIKREQNQEHSKRELFFRGEYDTFSLSGEDEDYQISYNEFIKNLGTDSTPHISTEKKKKITFDTRKSPLNSLFD